jgi:hypothetical protein
MPTSNSTTRAPGKIGIATTVDVESAEESMEVASREGQGCLMVNVDRLLDFSVPLAPSIPGFEAWTKLRQTLTVFPFPRGDWRPMAEGVMREDMECHAVEIGACADVSMIIDRRLQRLLPDPSSTRSASHLLPSVIQTNWTEEEAEGASRNRWSQFFFRHALGRKPKLRPSASRRNENIEVGLGVIRTASGRKRERQDTVTMVFHEPNSSDRIEVRIVGMDRVVRLRFDSRRDPRFQIFWPRWVG